jgi:hypothetical protein
VAAKARVVQVVLHVERNLDPASAVGLRNAQMTQGAGCPWRIGSYAFVRIELLICGCSVALEAVIAGTSRCPVPQEAWILIAVLDTRMLALEDNIVARGTYDLSFPERWRETLSDVHITGRYSRHVTARYRRTASTVATLTRRLGVRCQEVNGTFDRR